MPRTCRVWFLNIILQLADMAQPRADRRLALLHRVEYLCFLGLGDFLLFNRDPNARLSSLVEQSRVWAAGDEWAYTSLFTSIRLNNIWLNYFDPLQCEL